ncbi:hypothetical protein ARAM_005651 [Aspergillus rambellii]|uniref:Peptidase S54 rhomboid domain-containing protein n=1 Tax=Aspergillus rambellii TaxID=308745 RepID=A0A0F8XHF7_9EURO|nr:hypothetical protein ARAM_005651 [Aspergillus rambellii]
MQTSGLSNAPITKFLLVYTIAASVVLSILDLKHVPGILVSPHLSTYGQYWRCLIWQVAGFANSTEALFGAMLAYQMRVVERAWGGRKTATFLLSTLPYTTLLPPLLLALIVRPLSLYRLNSLPSGPTASLFALLAQYYACIPSTYKYCLSLSGPGPGSSHPQEQEQDRQTTTASLSDKSITYLVAAQLALSQFPTMVLPATVGFVVGLAWRADLLPGGGASGGWRIPGWVVGEKGSRLSSSAAASATATATATGSGARGETGFEDLRRRLESEAAVAGGSGSGRQRGL